MQFHFMTDALIHVEYVPLYTASSVNFVWILQDYLRNYAIKANIEVELSAKDNSGSFSIVVPGDKIEEAQKLIGACAARCHIELQSIQS